MDAIGDDRSPWNGDGHPLALAGVPLLQYQPVIDLGSGQLLGFEALLRWRHPTEGIILPPQLIPWAEASGDIIEIGEWVLATGCKDAMHWPSSIQLAVNLSVIQLRRGVASSAVALALEESGIAADRLTVEVTERALSDEAAVADLRVISSLGVQLAVDDVGTSWNSFEILRRLSINTVKIDQSFVLALEPREGINRMVVESVVNLAHNCGMSTVAEGVETAIHAAIVAEFESDAAQGYFFAPPLGDEHATQIANVTNLRFPLSGPGWRDDDDWPVPTSSLSNGSHGSQGRGPALRLSELATVAPAVEIDAIDMVDLVLSGPMHAEVHLDRANGSAADGSPERSTSPSDAGSSEVGPSGGEPSGADSAENDPPEPAEAPKPASRAKSRASKATSSRGKAAAKPKPGQRGSGDPGTKPARTRRRPTTKGDSSG